MVLVNKMHARGHPGDRHGGSSCCDFDSQKSSCWCCLLSCSDAIENLSRVLARWYRQYPNVKWIVGCDLNTQLTETKGLVGPSAAGERPRDSLRATIHYRVCVSGSNGI